jgi:hypothetical protein
VMQSHCYFYALHAPAVFISFYVLVLPLGLLVVLL